MSTYSKLMLFFLFFSVSRGIYVEGASTKHDCPSNWVSLASSCYYFSKIKTTWSTARSSCRNLGGDLAVPQNSDENIAINKISKQRGHFTHNGPWIGIVRHSDNKFYTTQGHKPTFTAWNPGEPNNYGSNENCVHFPSKLHNKWNDLPCSYKLHFVCSRKKLVAKKLLCGENRMKFVVRKTLFTAISSGKQLQLLDASCKPREAKYHYIFVTSLTGCGTRITTDGRGNGTVTFSNKVIENLPTFGKSITRSKETHFPFSCHYPRSYFVSTSPSFGLNNVTATLDNVTGEGNMKLVLNMFKDASFTQSVVNQPSLNKRLYVEINSTSSSKAQNLFGIRLNECYATSTGSKHTYKHVLIKSGCKKDRTVKFYQSPGGTTRFSFLTFRFRGLRHYTTHLHCRVTICDKANKSCNVKCQLVGKRKRIFANKNDEPDE